MRSMAVTNRINFSPKKSIFLYASATCSELPSNISTMVKTGENNIKFTCYFNLLPVKDVDFSMANVNKTNKSKRYN